jgi:general secretion pathway protein N
MAGCTRSLGALGGLGLAASVLFFGEAAAQTGSFAAQAALETNSLPTGGFSQPPPDLGASGITPALRDPVPDTSRPKTPAQAGREVRGNPLWAIPLASLNATRERPIFLPSRRAPVAAVAAPPPPPEPVRPPPPAEPERPRLALVGAVVGDVEAVAIFLDQATRNIVRLRTGEDYAGWILRSVKGREATLAKGRETVLLALPAPGEQAKGALEPDAQPIPPAVPAAPVYGVPAPPPMGVPAIPPSVRVPPPPPARRTAPRPPRGPAPPPSLPPA